MSCDCFLVVRVSSLKPMKMEIYGLCTDMRSGTIAFDIIAALTRARECGMHASRSVSRLNLLLQSVCQQHQGFNIHETIPLASRWLPLPCHAMPYGKVPQ